MPMISVALIEVVCTTIYEPPVPKFNKAPVPLLTPTFLTMMEDTKKT